MPPPSLANPPSSRRKRLYLSQDISELLQQQGVPLQKLLDVANTSPAEISLRIFDDLTFEERSWEEYVDLAKQVESRF
jgi:hypothetical protein